MIHLANSTSSRSGCESNSGILCCPWRMPSPRIRVALLRLRQQLTPRGHTHSVTSQQRHDSSGHRRPSFLNIFRKRSNRIEPFHGGSGEDAQQHIHGRSDLEGSGSKSSGTGSKSGDHFASLPTSTTAGKQRTLSSRRRMQHQARQTPDSDAVSCRFTLPGAVSDVESTHKMIVTDGSSQRSNMTITSAVKETSSDECTVDDDFSLKYTTGGCSWEIKWSNDLDRCPHSVILIEHLQSARQVSRIATRHLTKALTKWRRISLGPFPRHLHGIHWSKAEFVDDISGGLQKECARYLGEMKGVFKRFRQVKEGLDEISE